MRPFAATLLIFLLFASSSALCVLTTGPSIFLSPEVDEFINDTSFMQRHVLKLDWPTYTWPGSVFFDPGIASNPFDTGLDAYHYEVMEDSLTISAMTRNGMNRNGMTQVLFGQHYFASEVDWMYGKTLIEDEVLVCYDEFTGLVTKVFDVKDESILGADYGLDAATYMGNGYWAFSTEVDGMVRDLSFTDDDIIITDLKGFIDVIPLTNIFNQEVGLDALHYLGEAYQGSWGDSAWLISTEVDSIDVFNDEDILELTFAKGVGMASLFKRGVDMFGHDVGLDALYTDSNPIPEPAPIFMAGLGLGILAFRFRKR